MAGIFPCHMDAEHAQLHREAARLSKGEKLGSVSVQILLDRLEELSHKSIYESDDTSILEVTTFFNSLMKTIVKRSIQNSISTEDIYNLTASMYKIIVDVGVEEFTSDITIDRSRACALSVGITDAITRILMLIQRHPFYKNFKGNFTRHVKNIETCHFQVLQYQAVIALHNLNTLVMEIAEKRLQEDSRIHGGTTCNTVNRRFFLNLSWNQALNMLILQKLSHNRASVNQEVYFHPSFFQMKSMNHAAIEQWRQRPYIGQIGNSSQSECFLCHETVSVEDLSVLSNCRHLACISCTEKWFKTKGSLECSYCRTTSLEYIRSSGYSNLINNVMNN